MTHAESLEKCPICMSEFVVEANTNSCSHTFCFECIEIWARNTNTCPLCKIEFNRISAKDKAVKKSIRVKRKVLEAVYDEEEMARLTEGIEPYYDDNDDDDDDDDFDEVDDDDNSNGLRGYSYRGGFVVNDETVEYEDDDDDGDEDEDEAEETDDEDSKKFHEDDDDDDEDDDDEVEIVRFLVNGKEMPQSSIYKKRKTDKETSMPTRRSERISFLYT